MYSKAGSWRIVRLQTAGSEKKEQLNGARLMRSDRQLEER